MGKAAAAAFGPILGKTLFNIMHARATVQRTRAQNNNTVRHGNSNEKNLDRFNRSNARDIARN